MKAVQRPWYRRGRRSRLISAPFSGLSAPRIETPQKQSRLSNRRCRTATQTKVELFAPVFEGRGDIPVLSWGTLVGWLAPPPPVEVLGQGEGCKNGHVISMPGPGIDGWVESDETFHTDLVFWRTACTELYRTTLYIIPVFCRGRALLVAWRHWHNSRFEPRRPRAALPVTLCPFPSATLPPPTTGGGGGLPATVTGGSRCPPTSEETYTGGGGGPPRAPQ